MTERAANPMPAQTSARRVRQLLATADFALVEMLTASRLRISLGAYKALLAAVGLASGLLITAVVLVGFSFLGDGEHMAGRARVWAAGALVCAAVATGEYLKESLTRRRFLVCRSANVPLLRAWDVDLRDVFIVYRGVPVTWTFVRASALAAAAVVLAPPSTPGEVLACAAAGGTLVAGCVATLALAARNALTPHRTGVPWHVLAICVPAAVVAGWSTRVYVVGASAPSGAPSVTASLSALSASAVVVTAVSAARLRSALRTMPSVSFTVGDARGPSASFPPVRHRRRGPSEAGALYAHVRTSWQADLVRGLVAGAALCTAAALGARAGRPALLDPATDLTVGTTQLTAGQLVAVATTSTAFVLGLVLAEVVIGCAGPSRLAAHLRTRWELGADVSAIARGALVVQLLPATVLAAAMTTTVALVTGSVILTGVTVCVALAAAAVIADTAIPPPTNADGTTVTSSVTLVATLVLAAPSLSLALTATPVRTACSVAWTVLLVVGAHLCLSHRVLHHPSSSTRSAPDTLPIRLSSRISVSRSKAQV